MQNKCRSFCRKKYFQLKSSQAANFHFRSRANELQRKREAGLKQSHFSPLMTCTARVGTAFYLNLCLNSSHCYRLWFFVSSWIAGEVRRSCDDGNERCPSFDHPSWLKSERWLRDTSFETEAAFKRCSLAAGHPWSWFPTSLLLLSSWLSIRSESPKRNTAASRLRLNNTSIRRCSVRASSEISVNNNNEPLKQRRTINHKLVPTVSP